MSAAWEVLPIEWSDKEIVVLCGGIRVLVDNDDVDHDQARSVANRIGSAEDLYEALAYARRFLKKADHDIDYVDRVLAKARGGE